MKFLVALKASLIFCFFLLATYYLHIAFLNVNVVLYAAIADGIFATALTGLVLFFWKTPFIPLAQFEKSLLVLIWILGGYAFAISIPTVLDRSLSFYLLEKLQQRGGGIRLESMPDVFIKEYMPEYRLIDIRLTEQTVSGTVVVENGCVKLTPKGSAIAKMSRFFRLHIMPSHRLLNGVYTDVLVDPFRNSRTDVDYQCK
jgi:hypothetical protein